MQEQSKTLKYHSKRENSKNYNQNNKEKDNLLTNSVENLNEIEDFNEKDLNYEKSSSVFLKKMTEMSTYLTDTSFNTKCNNNKQILFIKQLTEENNLLKSKLTQNSTANLNQNQNETGSTANITQDLLIKYMDSLINLQNKVEKLEKENIKLKSYIKKTRKDSSNNNNNNISQNNASYHLSPRLNYQTTNSNSDKIEKLEGLFKLQMNCMKEIGNFFKKGSYFNNSHNDLQYVTSLPDKDKIHKENNHLNDSGFSDLCFEESFDVNNISNSQDEDKKKGNLLTSSGNNHQNHQSQQVNNHSNHVFNSHTHNRGNTISNYNNLKPSVIKIKNNHNNHDLITSHITINEQSTNTVKHKDENTSTILKNSTQKSNYTKKSQGLAALTGSNSHNNINSLNFNNIGTNIGIINQTSSKRSNFSNNNYLISKAKQSVDGNKGFK